MEDIIKEDTMKHNFRSNKFIFGLILSATTLANLTPAYAGPDSCYAYYRFALTKNQGANIENLDFVALYKDVLFNFRNETKDAWLSNYSYVTGFHAKVKEMIYKEMSESDRIELAREVQDTGYYLPQKRDAIDNVKHHSLGAKINTEALNFLKKIAQSNRDVRAGLDNYYSVYENFATGGNKIKASKLGLKSLSMEQVIHFFKLAGKDLTAERVQKILENDEVIVNVYQQSFSDLQSAGRQIQNEVSRKAFEKAIVENQMNALASSLIVSKISKDLENENRYLKLTVEQRNKITWMLYTYVGQYAGAEGYRSDILVRSKYENIPLDKLVLDQSIDQVVSRKIAELEGRDLKVGLLGTARQATLIRMFSDKKLSGLIRNYIKDAPTYAIKITSENWSTLPTMLKELGVEIGTFDLTKYPKGLEPYIGSVVNLQISKGKVDAYPVALNIFKKSYASIPNNEVAQRSANYASQMAATQLGARLSDFEVVSILRTEPTEMILMSQAGYDISSVARIQAPWGGTQTKPAEKDAHLAILRNLDGSIKEVYVVQIDEVTGLPQNYIVAPKQ